MQFKLKTLFAVVTTAALLAAFWAFENGSIVEVDSGFNVPVTVRWNPTLNADARPMYALISEGDLSEFLNNPDYTAAQNFEDFRLLKPGQTDVHIPVTTLESPLLGRNLGSKQPNDCLVILVIHEFGTLTDIYYNDDFENGAAPCVDIDAQITNAKKQPKPNKAR